MRLESLEFCCRGARRGERLGIAPAFDTNAATPVIQIVNRRWIHVRCRGNRSGTAVTHIFEQKRFAADKHVEPSPSRTGGFGKRVEKSLGVIPIARAVLHSSDRV